MYTYKMEDRRSGGVCTNEVDDQAAIGGAAGGAAEEGLAVGRLVEGDGGEAVALEDEVPSVRVAAAPVPWTRYERRRTVSASSISGSMSYSQCSTSD
jgi:hypothetical protein